MNISQPERGGNGESLQGGESILAPARRHRSASSAGPLLPKHHHRFAKSGGARNSFDCVTPHAVRSGRWVRDRHHVGSSHRILRLHERLHFHRPRRRRLPVAVVAPALPCPRSGSQAGRPARLAPDAIMIRPACPLPANAGAGTSFSVRNETGPTGRPFLRGLTRDHVDAAISGLSRRRDDHAVQRRARQPRRTPRLLPQPRLPLIEPAAEYARRVLPPAPLSRSQRLCQAAGIVGACLLIWAVVSA